MDGALGPVNLVTYNIRFGMGVDGHVDLGRIADAVRGADIIALQEVERYWKRSTMCDQPARLAEHLPEYRWTYFPAFDVDASQGSPAEDVPNRRRQFGSMTLSRFPIRSVRRLALPKCAEGEGFHMDTGVLECVVDAEGGALRIYNLHLGASSRDQRIQIPRLLELCQDAERGGGAWSGHDAHLDIDHKWDNDEAQPPMPAQILVLGDFNCEPGSAGYLLMVDEGSFIDSWVVARERGAARVTWISPNPARHPRREMTIDYCFLSPELAPRIGKAWVDDAAQGSDHRPYWVELTPLQSGNQRTVSVAAGAAVELSAQTLKNGTDAIDGRLGDTVAFRRDAGERPAFAPCATICDPHGPYEGAPM